MFVEDMVHLGKVRSEIREIFEYGNKRKQRDLCLQGGGVFRADNKAVCLLGGGNRHCGRYILRLKRHFRQGNGELALHDCRTSCGGNGIF